MQKEQYIELLLKKRNEYWKSSKNHRIRGMQWRNALHPLLVKLLKINRVFIPHSQKQVIHIIGDKRDMSNTKPVIYGFTHIGVDDVQILTEAIDDHVILFAGDPKVTIYTLGGFMFWLNGVIWCDTDSKTDRRIATEIAIETLKQGNNIAIYPEGIWNITSNLPVLPLFPGILRMAWETGCNIIPVAIDHNGNDYYVNIGKQFTVSADKEMITFRNAKKELRDIMATLKWEIWEAMPHVSRKDFGRYEIEKKMFVDSILREWIDKKTGRRIYTEELVEQRTFKEKEEIS